MKDLFRMRLSRGLAGVVIVLTALIVGAGVHELDRVEALAEVASLRVTTDLIRETIPALDRLDRSALMTIRDAAGLAEVRVVIARPDGSVLLDTESAPGAIAARDPLPERLRLEHGTGPTILTASRDPEGRPARVVVRPLSSAGSLPGQIVAIRAPGRPRVDSVSPTLRFLLVALGLMGAALGLLAVLVRRAVAFLEVVDHVVETVAAGNLSRTEVDAMGEDMGYFGSHLNIIATQLQERLDVIIDERRRSERILESIGDGVIAVDADGSILMVNDTARKLLGVGGDLVAQRPGENLGPDLRRLVAWSRDPVESTLLTEVGPGPTPVEIRCDEIGRAHV